MRPATSPRPSRTILLAAALIACLTLGVLLALTLFPGHDASKLLPKNIAPWLAAIGAPGILIGLWLNHQRDSSLGEAISPSAPAAPPPVNAVDSSGLAIIERSLQRIADGNLEENPDLARLSGACAPLATSLNRMRESIAKAHLDIERGIDSAGNGLDRHRPDVTQPGRYGKTAMKLELLLQDNQHAAALVRRLDLASAAGEFSTSEADAALAATPVGQAALRLLATVDGAFAEIGRIADALAAGDLTQRIESGLPGRLGEVCGALNNTVVSLRETMGRLDAVVDTVAGAARDIAAGNDTLAASAQAQAASLEETASSMEELNAVVQQNAETARSVTQFVDQATAMAEGSSATMLATRQTMDELADSARRIEAIVGVIDSLAFQTNILALNAAVEAARAGEQGRGFAVVAAEVRQLSLRSGEAAQDIRRLIGGTVNQTTASIQRVESLSGDMEQLISTIRQINDRMRDIQSASNEQATGLGQVSQAIMRIDDATQQTSGQVEEAATATRQLYGQSRGLHHLLKEFDLGAAGETARRIHREMPPLVRKAAADIGRLWEMALARHMLDESALFDDDYQAFGNSQPAKYHTRFDAIADTLLPRIQEPFLQVGAHVSYTIACDRNGYVPTHNQRYCEALTGDPDYDRLHNRTKRLFSDPVGQRCGKHPLPYLLQTYRRDTGEIVHDISAPIIVNGKHWGGFRVGYKTVLEI